MYFERITSFAELKKQYRKLAMENHPDRGGSEEAMKAINAEFEKLYEVWKDRTDTSSSTTGYESDYASATAREYASYVYNEYRWSGSNFNKFHEYSNKKINEHIRQFLNETYPTCKFSVRKDGYNSIYVSLMKADFYPYKDHSKMRGTVNHYWIREETELTDRCKEVFMNVIDYVQSWNYDNSDIMTDYFDVNFYADFSIGGNGKDFVYEPVLLGSKDDVFKRKKGAIQKMVDDACGAGNCFYWRRKWVWDEKREQGHYEDLTDMPKILCKDDDDHYPVTYSQPSLVKDRLAKLERVGVLAKATGGMYQKIELVGYTPALELGLATEKAIEDKREREFYERKKRPSTTLEERKTNAEEVFEVDIKIVDYSEKAIAVIGETKKIAEKLKELGGRFNGHLNCGAGWIFSKKKENELREAFNL